MLVPVYHLGTRLGVLIHGILVTGQLAVSVGSCVSGGSVGIKSCSFSFGGSKTQKSAPDGLSLLVRLTP